MPLLRIAGAFAAGSDSLVPMHTSPSEHLEDYEVGEQIGAGGMGTVYRAKDRRLHRRVALKILSPDELPEVAKSRLLREARLAAAVDHPFVCKVYEAGSVGDSAFIAMEYVEGTTLKELIKERRLDRRQILQLAIETCEALEIAHQIGLAHRDLKPANLLVTAHHHIKLLDFGIAKPLVGFGGPFEGDGGDPDPEDDDLVVGTPAYMSPELVLGDPVDGRADLFALGIILHEALTGTHPFWATTAKQLMLNIVRNEASCSGPLGTLSGRWKIIVERLLEKDPVKRYSSAAAVRRDLETLRDGPGSAAGAGQAEIPALAVLPFDNLGPNRDNDYFSDGLAEEINLALARVSGLRVIARSSSFVYRDNPDMREVAQGLGVDHLVIGSVRQAGGRVRVAVQLVEPSSGDYLWQESFDSTLEDIFSVQDEIANSVAQAMRTRLTEATSGLVQLEPVSTTDSQTYSHFLRARSQVNMYTEDSLRDAVESLQQAIESDPGYAPSYSYLAAIYLAGAYWGSIPTRVAYPMALELCEQALAIDPNEPEALTNKALVLSQYLWKTHEAERLWQAALASQPSKSTAHYTLALHYAYHGQRDEAISLAMRAHSLDPLSPMVAASVGGVLTYAGRFQDAVDYTRSASELHPNHPLPAVNLAGALGKLGRFEEALQYADRILSVPGGAGKAIVGCLHAKNGDLTRARHLLDQLQGEATEELPMYLARAGLLTSLDEHDAALDLVERAVDAKESVLILGVDPYLADLKVYMRYQQLLQRVGLPSRLDSPSGLTGPKPRPKEIKRQDPASQETVSFGRDRAQLDSTGGTA